MIGKCFPVGPRHVCMTLHQIVASRPQKWDGPFSATGLGMQSRIKAESLVQEFVLQAPASTVCAADADDAGKDCVILEVDAPPDAKPFDRWLYPVAPRSDRPVYCPVRVPGPDVVLKQIEPLIAGWDEQQVDVADASAEIETFFKRLGNPGSMATLRGDIAHQRAGGVGVRVACWPTQLGGFMTHESGPTPTTFCGILCGNGAADGESTLNAAVAASSERFLAQYEAVLATLPTSSLPEETTQLLRRAT